MKKVLILSLLFITQFVHAELWIKQEIKTKYYAEFVMEAHLKSAARFLSNEALKMGCLGGEFDNEVTKKAKPHLFKNADPGEVRFQWETACKNTDIVDIRFSIDTIGYDEDYTLILVKFTSKSRGNITKSICGYGLDRELRNCPEFENEAGEWSTDIE